MRFSSIGGTESKSQDSPTLMKQMFDLTWTTSAHLRVFFWRHVVWSVLVFLATAWFLVSWGVYCFEHGAQGSNIVTFADSLWWGIVTLFTVGYGDKYPVTPEGRELAGMLIVSGVGCTGIITAKVSSVFLEQALRDGRGFVDSSKLKNHFIICGLNENMFELLTHILDYNAGLSSRDIVLVANASPAQIEALKTDPRLEALQVITGDHFSEVNLKRAAPERAKKILILADRTPSPTGQIPTPTEVDARTIMTAMTLANVARGTLVTAEILDPKMDHYLKLGGVSEIIYSSEYSRLLLGNATGGTGIANIVLDLLDSKTGSHITSYSIPDMLISRPYAEMKSLIEENNPTLQVVGVLENSGNAHSIRELALRRAQQTPDMAQLVSNLRSVKEIRCNNPVFNPDPNYIVREGSMAIVIATRINPGASRVQSRSGQVA
jgi:voltage-gated potassium channel